MPIAKLPRERLRAGLMIALLVCTALALLQWPRALERLEWISYDKRMQFWRADVPLHEDIAVVLIDEHSLAYMDARVGRFPWPRSLYAEMIEFFRSVGAKAVVFDILFAEQDRTVRNGGAGNEDWTLSEAGRIAGNVYHAAEFHNDIADEGTTLQVRRLPELFRTRFAISEARDFPERGINNYTLPLPGLLETSRGVGGVTIRVDPDGVFRRNNLFFTYQGSVFPAMGVAPILSELGQPIRFERGAIRFGDTRVPLDHSDQYLVNMAGDVRPHSISGIFATINQLNQGDVENLLVDPYQFAGKVVFIGSNAVGLQDLKTTALSTQTPGVYIHASIMSNLLRGDFLRPLPLWLNALLAMALVVVTVFSILASNRVVWQFTIPAMIALAHGAFAVWAFGQGLVLDMALPFTGVTLALLSTSGFLVFTEGRDKRRVRAMFSQYVSPAVLEQVVDHYRDQLRAEVGAREHLSVLFSDVRGFTSLSEKLQAEQVVDLLNIHFSVMGEIIFRHHGTLDKFIGDAIMAFWGAPIRVPDHARSSVCAAIEMSRNMARVNEQLAARGYPPIDVGIGINTGDVVLGNIGSDRKLDYTVIGDHVNLGSRLEGLTKQYGCPIIISEYTYQELQGEIPCAVVDLVRVKGKQVPIRIYWPLALPTDAPADIAHARTVAELSDKAFTAYLARQFEEAEMLYVEFPASHLRDLFIERCRRFREQPPAADWDGVYTLTTK